MKISVNALRCEQIARRLDGFSIPRDREENSLDWLTSHAIGNYYLLLVAICHQTQTLNGLVNGIQYRGWDFLTRSLEEGVRRRPPLLEVESWVNTSENELVALFGTTLTEPVERAKLVRDLGVVMLRESWTSLDDLYKQAEGRISVGKLNLLELLSRFKAFSDPVNKKAFFLLGLMQNSRGWEYADPSNLGAPVDYHEVRGHLRIGTITVHDSVLERCLMNGIPVSESDDVAIRSNVFAAIASIAVRLASVPPMTLHYLFWNLFRNVCLREVPYCFNCPDSLSVPPQYSQLLQADDGSLCCPFSQFCPSAKASHRFIEHRFETDWY